jgi:protein TonB
MATKDFDLTSPRWLSLVFDGKNKEYGAYELRNDSSNRHLKALLIVTFVGLFLVFLPKIIKSVLPAQQAVEQVTAVDMTDLSLEDQVPEENLIKEIENVPPPPALKETVAFVPPVIKHDDEIDNEKLMITQQELTESDRDISVQTVEGVKDGGVDIADIVEHKVVIEEPTKPHVFDHVEVMPSFPGGDTELMKWLHDNIQFPTIAAEQGISGRVTVRFVVTADGSVENVEIQKGLDPSCDKEALRAVKKMPKWNPGKQNGNPVYVYFSLPINFKLQNQ